MQDLAYIWNLGFTPGDAIRAILLALFASLFMRVYKQIWRVTTIAFWVDFALPFITMGFAGHDGGAVVTAVFARLFSFPADIGIHLIRFIVMFWAVSIGYSLRRALHSRFGEEAQEA